MNHQPHRGDEAPRPSREELEALVREILALREQIAGLQSLLGTSPLEYRLRALEQRVAAMESALWRFGVVERSR